MLLESLARLTLVNEYCKENNIVLESEQFMKETSETISQQIEVLKKDLSFQTKSPGPYVFGLGKKSINIFPPTFTESSDWIMIIYNEETDLKEDMYVFQTMYGLIENLANAFKHIEDASSREQDRQSETKA
jgi:hypothetical protein